MAKHYTNVLCQGNYILYRGVNNGKKVKTKVTYTPSLFVKSKKAEKAKAQKRFDEINKQVSKSKNKKATTEKYIDEVGKLYKEMD